MSSKYTISSTLHLKDVALILNNQLHLELSNESRLAIENCRIYLDKKLDGNDKAFYGINTGFGSLCNTRISDTDLSKLQENLLLSHACGTGDFVPHEIVKLMLLLKIQSLAAGHSAVQVETVEMLMAFFNKNLLPVVYEQGSLGASGDLAPLAHLSLPLIGHGEFWVEEAGTCIRKPAAEVLKEVGLKPITLKSKEGLALINGTQFMSAYGSWLVLKSQSLFGLISKTAALSLEAFDGRPEPFEEALHRIRPHAGQLETARQMRELLAGSALQSREKVHVQDPYAFRCIPQVHGASFDTIAYAASVIEREISSVTDNPNVFPEDDRILSGGNFHGQPLALVLDFLAIALAELGSISERRTYQLIAGLRGLPAFLTANPGLNSGFMIPQYTAASIVSQNKQYCTPASADSIVSSNGQEDHVSMGANAATKCLKVYINLEKIIAIELMNAAQAIEFRRPFTSSTALEDFLAAYRKHVSRLEDDRYLHADIQGSVQFIQNQLLQ